MTAARQRREVLLVRDASEVAPALTNIARLTASGKSTAPELFAMTTMLGAMADSLATATDTASRSPRVSESEGLTPTVATLGAYRSELASLVRFRRSALASLGQGNPAALAQARELRTAGVPHLEALMQDQDRAASALQAYRGRPPGSLRRRPQSTPGTRPWTVAARCSPTAGLPARAPTGVP